MSAMSAFAGFGPDVGEWFRGLEADNSREYFAAHRTAPRGYPKDHARIELLRRQSLSLGTVRGRGRPGAGAGRP